MDEEAIKEMRAWFKAIYEILKSEAREARGDREEEALVSGKMLMMDDVEEKFQRVLRQSRKRARAQGPGKEEQ